MSVASLLTGAAAQEINRCLRAGEPSTTRQQPIGAPVYTRPMSGDGRRHEVQEAPPSANQGALAQLASHVDVEQAALAQFCRRHHIRRLALFGSVLRDDFGPASDIDVLVEFEPAHIPGLAFFTMQDELSELFHRQVDLNTLEWLSPYFRETVAQEAVVLYDAT
jgi:uncharacterized protein